MSRGIVYTREKREQHIARKKRIVRQCAGINDWYNCDGKYDKGKIHCSCGVCRAKTNNKSWKKRKIHGNYAPNHNWKAADRRKIDRMEYIEDSYTSSYRPNEDEDIDWFDADVDDVTIDGEPLDGKYFDCLIS